MLRIISDLENQTWLEYIVQEFKRIEKAQFPIEILDHQSALSEHKQDAVIYYTIQPENGICIPNQSEKSTLVNSLYLSDDIFVLENTITADNGYYLNYDLLWNAFAYLTRLEEYEHELRGNSIRSYSRFHPRVDKSTFSIPIVNVLFRELKKIITSNFSHLQFETLQKPKIELSHDLDYINKTLPLRIKQTAFNVFNLFKQITKPRLFVQSLKRTVRFLFSTPSYWCFDYWQNLEDKFGVRSIYFIYAKTRPRGLKKWLLDPSYDISKNILLQDRLKDLLNAGFRMGIHGSFHSAEDKELLAREKAILEKSLATKIKFGRQHWLRYNERLTPMIHEKILDGDSTLGWNDISGFRSGCCSRFNAYFHEENRPLDLMITPQLIMDSHLFDYASNNSEERFHNGAVMIQSLVKFQNACVAISWHPRTSSSDYNWHLAYEKYLEIIARL